jgi:lysylphosphatidylglycerol synthetase-like protein (DUF2156 family)
MTGSKTAPEWTAAARTATRPGAAWHHVWGLLLPIAAALALWAWALAGVLAPLSGALAQLDAARERAAAPLACPTPPGALASAAAIQADRCR